MPTLRPRKIAWNLSASSLTVGSEQVLMSVQCVAFGGCFNDALDTVVLPDWLNTLTFGRSFNHSVGEVSWPASLKTLIFGGSFIRELTGSRGWHYSLGCRSGENSKSERMKLCGQQNSKTWRFVGYSTSLSGTCLGRHRYGT